MKKAASQIQVPESNEAWELYVVLRQANDIISKARNDELVRTVGISRIQSSVMFAIKSSSGPVTPSMISRWLVREPHTVKGVLDGMEKQGLIGRAKDLPRKNLIRVYLTEKGEEVYRQTRKTSVIAKIISGIPPRERKSLKASLEKLRNQALGERLESRAGRRAGYQMESP